MEYRKPSGVLGGLNFIYSYFAYFMMKNRHTVQNGASIYLNLRKPDGIYLKKKSTLSICYIVMLFVRISDFFKKLLKLFPDS